MLNMPKYIPNKDKHRMFPFEFYDEISERLSEFVFINPAFMVDLPVDERKKIYQDTLERVNEAGTPQPSTDNSNIIYVEPVGEVLLLDLMQERELIKDHIANNESWSHLPLTALVAQLYDSSGLPIFSEDVTQETIAQIPEVLWDDPNLLLGILQMGSNQPDGTVSETSFGILTIPYNIYLKLFEDVQSPE